MKPDAPKLSPFERFMHWAGGTTPHAVPIPGQSMQRPQSAHHAASHEHPDPAAAQSPIPEEIPNREMHIYKTLRKNRKSRFLHHHSSHFHHTVRLYRILSIVVAAALTLALIAVALQLPRFGDASAPTVNEVSDRYLEQGVAETGAVNAVAGMILDYRAFDTFGESTVLFAATMSVVLLLRNPGSRKASRETDRILNQMGRIILPAVMMYGIYVVLNGHLSPGGGFSGGTVLGCGLILAALILGEERMEQLLPHRFLTLLSVGCLLAYGLMKGYSFLTGANHFGWEIPKGIPGNIFSAGFILPLNICVGVIVACTMYTFYTLFIEKEA